MRRLLVCAALGGTDRRADRVRRQEDHGRLRRARCPGRGRGRHPAAPAAPAPAAMTAPPPARARPFRVLDLDIVRAWRTRPARSPSRRSSRASSRGRERPRRGPPSRTYFPGAAGQNRTVPPPSAEIRDLSVGRRRCKPTGPGNKRLPRPVGLEDSAHPTGAVHPKSVGRRGRWSPKRERGRPPTHPFGIDGLLPGLQTRGPREPSPEPDAKIWSHCVIANLPGEPEPGTRAEGTRHSLRSTNCEASRARHAVPPGAVKPT